jgi:hypothetical protein
MSEQFLHRANVVAAFKKITSTWWTQDNWASNLTVNLGGTVYDDWRLPKQYRSPQCFGYNCTDTEMGHLYYAELGNPAYGPLTYKSPFINLSGSTWSQSSFEFDSTRKLTFQFNTGLQGMRYVEDDFYYGGLAVREGDVALPVVPEPISSILFVTGGTLLAGRRLLKRAEDRKRGSGEEQKRRSVRHGITTAYF